MHVAVADAIGRVRPGERFLAERARQLLAAAPVADPARVIETASRAADAAVRSFAYEDAVELVDSVLSLALDDAMRAELLLQAGKARSLSGNFEIPSRTSARRSASPAPAADPI